MTTPADTLVCDTLGIANWQADPAYDYNRELVAPEVDLLGWTSRWISELLRTLFGSPFAEHYAGTVLIILMVILLLLLLWFLYRKHPALFMRSRRNQLPYSVYEDTIYGVDFRGAIAAALQNDDLREAVRLLYLQTLKQLSDAELIDWQLSKTPTEYLSEVKGEELRAPFRRLTNHFLRVRYGHFEASEPLFRQMQSWQAEMKIEKGGKG